MMLDGGLQVLDVFGPSFAEGCGLGVMSVTLNWHRERRVEHCSHNPGVLTSLGCSIPHLSLLLGSIHGLPPTLSLLRRELH